MLVHGIDNSDLQIFVKFVNVTLDDTDPFIIYSPSTSWHASTVPCASCLAPPNSTAFDFTWHDGTHIIPTSDNDDNTGDGDAGAGGDGTPVASSTLRVVSSADSKTKPPSPKATSDPDDDGDDDDDDSGHHKQKGKTAKRGSLARRSMYVTAILSRVCMVDLLKAKDYSKT